MTTPPHLDSVNAFLDYALLQSCFTKPYATWSEEEREAYRRYQKLQAERSMQTYQLLHAKTRRASVVGLPGAVTLLRTPPTRRRTMLIASLLGCAGLFLLLFLWSFYW